MKKLISLFLLAGALLALSPVYAEDIYGTNDNTSTSTIPIGAKKRVVVFDPLCIQNAVDKRDNALIAATDAFSASIKTALQTRRDALKAGWVLTDRTARRAALKAAWKAYDQSLSAARKALNNAKRMAWSAWNKDRWTCKGTPNDEAMKSRWADWSL